LNKPRGLQQFFKYLIEEEEIDRTGAGSNGARTAPADTTLRLL
jgi:hypothetical protein